MVPARVSAFQESLMVQLHHTGHTVIQKHLYSFSTGLEPFPKLRFSPRALAGP